MTKQTLTAGEIAARLTAEKIEPLVRYVEQATSTKLCFQDQQQAHESQEPKKGPERAVKPLYTDSDRARETAVKSEPAYRSDFRRDYARLLHCPAFRRLQGKTQLFPSSEHDFFRNRLTHSLEVAQIAKSIALRLNHLHCYFKDNPIDLDLVETAALAHDLGHPPFGHNGEQALDDCMKKRGGFEGNAQSLRILARLEKKEPQRMPEVGLNLTHRTLAATLKYDRAIPIQRKKRETLVKGFYDSEKELVERIKRSVLGNAEVCRFKTIECQIMDVADDIAYSTYDLEDALKAGFVTADEILALREDDTFEQVKTKLNTDRKLLGIDAKEIDIQDEEHLESLYDTIRSNEKQLNDDGTARTKLTSRLVNEYIEATNVEIDKSCPAMSNVYLDNKDLMMRMKFMKHVTYTLVIQSPALKTVEYRGYDIVKDIFKALSKDDGEMLLPDDYRVRVKTTDQLERYRAICDFIAGMTDRYAIEFHGRLYSDNVQTIFKPL